MAIDDFKVVLVLLFLGSTWQSWQQITFVYMIVLDRNNNEGYGSNMKWVTDLLIYLQKYQETDLVYFLHKGEIQRGSVKNCKGIIRNKILVKPIEAFEK